MGLARPGIEQHLIRMDGQGRLTKDRAHVPPLDKPLLEDWQANTELSLRKRGLLSILSFKEGAETPGLVWCSLLITFYLMWMGVLTAGISVHLVHAWYTQRPERTCQGPWD